MITVREVPEPGTVDLIEEGLLYPVPGIESNSILMEDRDGSDVRRILAKAALVERDGKRLSRVSDVRIDVFITDARVALACTKYDKGGGWSGYGAGGLAVALAFNAGSKALAAGRRRGKMLVGQVRYPWLATVGSSAKFGMGSEERLYFKVKTAQGETQVLLTLPKNLDAAAIAAEIARRAAAYRLACEPDLEDIKRARFVELTQVQPIEPVKGKSHHHVFPDYWTISEKSARMLPVADGGAAALAASAVPEASATPPVVAATLPAPAQIVAEVAATAGFCTSCGSPLKPGVSFCTHCGSRVATA
jgi:hypothetical protein